MSEKFIVNGGLEIPSNQELKIGDNTLNSILTGDDLSNAEANKKVIPSEYSVKTYVDAKVSANNQWNLNDGANNTVIDSDETLTLTGDNNGLSFTVADNALSIAFDSSVTLDTLTVSTNATLADGSQLASAAAPSADSDIANKKYVDDQLGSSALGFTADDGTASLAIDLDTESLTIAGGDNLTTTSAGNTATVAMDSDISLTSGTFSSKVTTAALSATGAANLDSTLDVDGQSDLKGAVNLAATGVATDIKGTLSVDEAATMDTTLAVTGVATFTAQSVHTGGIDCNGTLDLGGQSIEGNADEMIISADGDENSASGGATDSLSLNANGGIFTDDAVDMDSTLNVESTVTMQADATVGTTLAVTGVGTFTAQSVHTGGIETGASIVSDTDSTDSLGAADYRWLSVHTDKMEMENSSKKDFSVAMDGTDVEVADLTGFESGKIVLKVKNSAGDITSKEILAINGSYVEYATISSGTEVSMTVDVDGDSVTVNSANGTAVGSVDLIK